MIDAIRDIGVVAGAVVGVGTAVTLLTTRVVRPIWRIWLETVERVKRLTELAEAELLPNHGSSMRDKLDEAEARTEQIETRLTEMTAVAREHIDTSSSLLFDVSTSIGDLNRQMEQHIADSEVHMRRQVWTDNQRQQARQLLEDHRRQHGQPDDG